MTVVPEYLVAVARTAARAAAMLTFGADREPPPVRDFGYAWPATERPAGSYERLPQLAVLSTARDEPGDWLRSRQALQRVLLKATGHGLAASFLYQPVELHDIEPQGPNWWPWPEHPQMIIRFGYGPRGADTPRRQVDEILDPQVQNS